MPKCKPRLLTNLRIDEISSVDAGAGEGVRVMLMKRDRDRAAPRAGAAPCDAPFGIRRPSSAHRSRAFSSSVIGCPPACVEIMMPHSANLLIDSPKLRVMDRELKERLAAIDTDLSLSARTSGCQLLGLRLAR
jgi:hypothetical protein